MHRKTFVAAVLFVLFACGIVLAQQSAGGDPIGDALFPPELVISHQDAIGLSDDQKKTLESAIETAQKTFTQKQWQLAAATEHMANLLKPSRVDQGAALAQLDKVLGLEREIKRTQVTLMIQIKNALSPEQQAKLRALKTTGTKH